MDGVFADRVRDWGCDGGPVGGVVGEDVFRDCDDSFFAEGAGGVEEDWVVGGYVGVEGVG